MTSQTYPSQLTQLTHLTTQTLQPMHVTTHTPHNPCTHLKTHTPHNPHTSHTSQTTLLTFALPWSHHWSLSYYPHYCWSQLTPSDQSAAGQHLYQPVAIHVYVRVHACEVWLCVYDECVCVCVMVCVCIHTDVYVCVMITFYIVKLYSYSIRKLFNCTWCDLQLHKRLVIMVPLRLG